MTPREDGTGWMMWLLSKGWRGVLGVTGGSGLVLYRFANVFSI